MAKELLEVERNMIEVNEKKKKKKKNKTETSSSEAKEEKECVEFEPKIEASSSEAKEEKECVESEPKNEAFSSQAKEENERGKRHANQGELVSETVLFHISRKKKYHIFVGSMGCDKSPMEECSFIPATNLQLMCYSELKLLGSSHAGILHVQQRICLSDQKTYLLVERVEPIDSFFEELMNSITELDKSKWWTMIADVFQRLFRDIIEALQFLYSKNEVCGNLSFGLYVTSRGRAKVLPSMNRKETKIDDLKQLIAKMKRIIGLPFGMINVARDPEFDLPPSLISFLISYNDTTEELVPWVLKAPFFWTMKEEFKFLDGLSELIRSESDLKWKFESGLSMYQAYGQLSWCNVLNGRYESVWRKKDPNRQFIGPLPFGCFRVNPYKLDCDLYRYLCAARKNINEAEYKTPTSTENYDEEKKASDIKGFFPTLYSDSHEIIYWILGSSPQWMDRFMNIF